jgi:hypothetical protein
MIELTANRRFQLKWFPPRATGPWKIPSDPDQFDVFLLLGQSNMAGFGGVRTDDPWQASDFDPVPGVLVLGGQAKLRSTRPRGRIVWRPAAHPMHLNQKSGGFGLGIPFAEALHEASPERTVGLIPCAWGGAAIHEINRGTPLFSNALRRAKMASRVGRLRGVLWHQGESDTTTEAAADRHASHLRKLIADLREGLDHPTLSFLIGDLAEFTEVAKRKDDPEAAEWNARVRHGLRDIASSDPHAAFVESTGLTGVDDVHFGRESLIEFGQRYAEAWRRGGNYSAPQNRRNPEESSWDQRE